MKEVYGSEKQIAFADSLITSTLEWVDGLSEMAKCDEILYDTVQSYRKYIVGKIDAEDAAPVIIEILKKIERLEVVDRINKKAYKKGSRYSLPLTQNLTPETDNSVKSGWRRNDAVLTPRESVAVYIAKTKNKSSSTFKKEEHAEEIEWLLSLSDEELAKIYNEMIDRRTNESRKKYND